MERGMADTDYRVVFDFEIEFTNGGGLRGRDFRLDIDGNDIDDAELIRHVVRDLRLLMVGPARILDKRIIAEPHKRRAAATAMARGAHRHVDLSHVIEDGLVTYPGLPAVHGCECPGREASRAHFAPGTESPIAPVPKA